jgi:hypothetical protein
MVLTVVLLIGLLKGHRWDPQDRLCGRLATRNHLPRGHPRLAEPVHDKMKAM